MTEPDVVRLVHQRSLWVGRFMSVVSVALCRSRCRTVAVGRCGSVAVGRSLSVTVSWSLWVSINCFKSEGKHSMHLRKNFHGKRARGAAGGNLTLTYAQAPTSSQSTTS